MNVFRWNDEEKHWHLFDEDIGIHCYLQQITSPIMPGTEHRVTDMPYIYTLVQARIEENATWALKSTTISTVYDALEYCEELLGYVPKFRDPQEEIHYATKEEK